MSLDCENLITSFSSLSYFSLDFELDPEVSKGRDEKKAAAVTTGDLTDSGHGKGLHMLVTSFHGHIYVVDGHSRCADRIDVGEHIYAMPVLDDITGDGNLDLVVGTMNGQVCGGCSSPVVDVLLV